MTTHTPPRCTNSEMVKLGSTLVLLNPGSYPSYSTFGNQTWIWNGTNGRGDWTQLTTNFINATPLGPSLNDVVLSGRVGQAMAYDGTNVVLFGGKGSSNLAGVFKDTWTFDGSDWTLNTPTNAPFGRFNAQAAYLAGTGAVLFGGETNSEILNETWIWNGSIWTQVDVGNGTGPAARSLHCMAASTTTVLLFGGHGTLRRFNDTWTFDGATWTKVTTSTSPSARDGACMAYDTLNNVWVMFGGQTNSNYLAETWTFDGATWTKITTTGSPAGRIGAAMAYDLSSRSVIMYGGITSTNTSRPCNETWAYDVFTSTWTKL